jgi:hypothetical protein
MWHNRTHMSEFRSLIFSQSLSSSRARAAPYCPRTGQRRADLVELTRADRNRGRGPSRGLPPALHMLVGAGRSSWSSRAPTAATTDLHLARIAPCSLCGGWRVLTPPVGCRRRPTPPPAAPPEVRVGTMRSPPPCGGRVAAALDSVTPVFS